MDSLCRRAITFVAIFVALSTVQKFTGLGSQPQFVCNLQNTFQMSTYVKRDTAGNNSADSSSLPSPSPDSCTTVTPPFNPAAILETLLRKICPKKLTFADACDRPKFSIFASPRNLLRSLDRQETTSVQAGSTKNEDQDVDSDDFDVSEVSE